MLQNFSEMLKDAYRGRYAVGSFNVYNYETMKGVVNAAVEMGVKSVIVAFGAKYLSNMSLKDAHAMAVSISDGAGIPVCLHLDHCSKPDIIREAVDVGFSSVMYDGSALPFEENLNNTKAVCELAHGHGASVEAELGSLAAGEASHEGKEGDRQAYTDPAAAGEFVRATGVDALAVSIGTVHGLYKGTPNIRIDILKKLNEALGIPLVLHGGSGTPEQTIKECIRNGISKINVNTEISVYTVEKTQEFLANAAKKPHLSVIAQEQQRYVAEVVKKYIGFFGGM